MKASARQMTRRDLLGMMGIGAAAAGLPRRCRAGEAKSPAAGRPNIILLMADDCSARELGCYGHPTHKTPNLDGLARTGVMFRTCWCTPICSPTRAEIMTGRYGFRTRWYHNNMKPAANEPNGDLSRSNLIFAQLLKKAGYATAIAGKWQLRGSYAAYGFDEHCMWHRVKGKFDGPVEGPEASLPGRAARYWHPAIQKNNQHLPTTAKDYGPDIFTEFVNDFARRHKDRPFCIYYPMCLTHKSWDFELKKGTYVPAPQLDARGRKTGRRTRDTLQSNVEYADHLVGRIIRNLADLGLRGSTVFLFTCDNGTVGYGKSNVWQERGPRVPMIVNAPGIVKALGPVDALIDFSDILPTLCDLAGARLPEGYVLDGKSFAPVLRGERTTTREWIFSYLADKRILRDKRWLLDGHGRLYDCGARRDEKGYRDVTDSNDPEVLAARKRFEKILAALPAPAPDDPLLRKYRQSRQRKRGTRRPKQPRPGKKADRLAPKA